VACRAAKEQLERLLTDTSSRAVAAEKQVTELHASTKMASTIADTVLRGMGGGGGGGGADGDSVAVAITRISAQLEEKLKENAALQGRVAVAEAAQARQEAASEASVVELVKAKEELELVKAVAQQGWDSYQGHIPAWMTSLSPSRYSSQRAVADPLAPPAPAAVVAAAPSVMGPPPPRMSTLGPAPTELLSTPQLAAVVSTGLGAGGAAAVKLAERRLEKSEAARAEAEAQAAKAQATLDGVMALMTTRADHLRTRSGAAIGYYKWRAATVSRHVVEATACHEDAVAARVTLQSAAAATVRRLTDAAARTTLALAVRRWKQRAVARPVARWWWAELARRAVRRAQPRRALLTAALATRQGRQRARLARKPRALLLASNVEVVWAVWRSLARVRQLGVGVREEWAQVCSPCMCVCIVRVQPNPALHRWCRRVHAAAPRSSRRHPHAGHMGRRGASLDPHVPMLLG
jgi:hypothetical protein